MEMVNDICEILNVIDEWREAAEKENSYFAKFALEYFAFNSLLRITFAPDKRVTDRTLIERFKGWIKCKNLKFKWKDDKNPIKELIEITRERDLKNLTKDKKIQIKNEGDWNNIIEAVYVIRNNLFHGHKQYSRERDEKLVEVGYEILSKFNDALISNLREYYLGGVQND